MKREHIVGIVLIILVIILVSGHLSTVSSYSTGSGIPPTATTTSQTFTMQEVAKHNSAQSCYTVIDNGVYDLTKWISQHPGGPEAIESICGIDGSTAFHGQHDHAAKQENILATFKIGTLAQ